MTGWLIAAVVVIAIVLWLYRNSRERKKLAMQLGAREYTSAIHRYGVTGVPEDAWVLLYFTDDKLIIMYKNNRFELAYSNIESAKSMKNGELVISERFLPGSGSVMVRTGGEKLVKGQLLILNYRRGHESKILVFDTSNYNRAAELAGFVEARLSGQTIGI